MEQPDITPDLLHQEETRYLLKSPGFVAGLSGLVMGLGQIFNGQIKKALVFFLAQVGIFLYLWDFVGSRVVADTLIGVTGPLLYHTFLTVLASAGLALWVFNIHDAYQTAQFLSFIFERSAPLLDEEEQEFVQASLNVNAMGVSVHRGSSRKALFVGVALLLYSAALLVLGARVSTTRAERTVVETARERPRDPKARLAHGEWLVTRGEIRGGRQELEEALKLAEALKDTGTMYRAYTSLARAFSELGRAEDANRCLREALALYAPASQETSALPGEIEVPAAAASPRRGGSPARAKASGVQGEALAEYRDPARPPPSLAASASPAPLTDVTATAVSFAVAQDDAEHGTAAGAAGVGAGRSPASIPGSPGSGEASAAAPAAPQGEPSELLSRALSNFKVKNYGEARRILDAYKRRGPETTQSLSLDGRLYAAVGEWSAAVAPLERAVEKGSVAVALEKLLAEALIRTGRTDFAMAHLRHALAKKPNDPESVLALSGLHRKAGRAAEARRLVEEALIETPEHPGLLAADYGLALDGNSDEAAYQVAMKLLKGPDRDAQLARSLVTQAMDASRLPLAHRLASFCIQNASAEPLGYILKGAVLVRQGQLRKAMQYFEKASGLGNQEPELFYEIAGLYRTLGRPERAAESLQRAIELAPDSVTYARELAALELKSGKFEAARGSYQLALRNAPGDLAARVGLGEALLRLGRHAEAKAAFAAVVSREPGHPEARRWLAVAEAGEPAPLGLAGASEGERGPGRSPGSIPSGSSGEGSPPTEAQRTVESGQRPEQMAAVPRTADAVSGAVAIAARAAPASESDAEEPEEEEEETAPPAVVARPPAGQLESVPAPAAPVSPADRRADETAARVLMGYRSSPRDEGLPRDVEKLMRDADVAYRAGDLAAAETRYRAVLASRPASVHAHYQLGLIHRARKDGAKAIVEMETARRLSPDDPDILLELGQIYTDANVTQRAIARLEDLVKIDPDNLAGRYTLGVNYEKARRLDSAELQYKAIEAKYPQFVQAHDYLGNLYFSQQRYELAAQQYGQLVAARPLDARARFKKAVALFYQDQRESARQEFTALARSLPGNDPLAAKVQGYLGKL